MDALDEVERWPAETVAVAVADSEAVIATRGPGARLFPWASVTKLLTASAVLVAAEERIVDLDEPAGPPGATVRHLLAHSSGLPFEGETPIAEPGRRRIYSNSGFKVLAEHVSDRTEMPFDQYLRAAVLEPLGLDAELRGSAGAGLFGSLADLLRVALELLAPTLVAPETLAEATSVQFPGLAGVIPEMGRFDPNDWGLGVELRDRKPGHWSGTLPSERTFGHWGGSGTFLWVDPDRELALACLTDLEFGDWARTAWPALSDAVVAEASTRRTAAG